MKYKQGAKEELIARYKVMQVQMQDKQGNSFFMKKKVSLPDSNLPTYIRIPPPPIPRSWLNVIKSLDASQQQKPVRYFESDVLTFDLNRLGSNFQAILMDPPFKLNSMDDRPDRITMDQFVQS